MIDVEEFYNTLKISGIDFYTGVPDSLLSELCKVIDDLTATSKHVLAANEGNAIATAAGYYLGSNQYAAVYMQNSGLGNAVNPLVSLTSKDVYGIPIFLIIGWRGAPGSDDEPQHRKQGDITRAQLDLLDIPYFVLDGSNEWREGVNSQIEIMKEEQRVVAVLVKEKSFSKCNAPGKLSASTAPTREQAIARLTQLAERALVISTTGKTSRELYEVRLARNEQPSDFLTVGSMGHASSIALGVALARPDRRVLCFDGDGALLMHMGSLPIIASMKPKNFIHVLLNNSCHESVGGHPTVAGQMDFEALASACGYKHTYRFLSLESLESSWNKINKGSGSTFVEVVISQGSRQDLGRPQSTPKQNRDLFMRSL